MSARVHANAAARGARAGQGWCMPPTVRNFGSNLLAQQLWCWGRDIECSGGNLLMQFGFERHRYRGDSDRSTCYRLDDDELHICMWGFGMFFGCRDLGGLFLGRFDFRPKWAPVESLSLDIHRAADLPGFARPSGGSQWQCARKLWTSLLQWIADYERWVKGSAGAEYRQKCVETWMRPFVRADRMASAWQFLSRRKWETQNEPVSQSLRKFLIAAAN